MHRFQIKEMSKETETYIKDTYGKELRGIQVLDHIEKKLMSMGIRFWNSSVNFIFVIKRYKTS